MNRYADMMMNRGRDHNYMRGDRGRMDMGRRGSLSYDYERDERRGVRGSGRGRRDRNMGMDYRYEDYGYMPYEDEYYYDHGYDLRRGVRRRRDYGDDECEYFEYDDIEDWKHRMKNEDGSHGEHFSKEQVEQATKQLGISPHEMGGMKVFCLAMNMMYSDYCKVAQKYGVDRPDYYAELAKAFLKDKDFEGDPEEKLYLYYKCIVDADE